MSYLYATVEDKPSYQTNAIPSGYSVDIDQEYLSKHSWESLNSVQDKTPAERRRERDRIRKSKTDKLHQYNQIHGTQEEKIKAKEYFEKKKSRSRKSYAARNERIKNHLATPKEIETSKKRKESERKRYEERKSKKVKEDDLEARKIINQKASQRYHRNPEPVKIRSKQRYNQNRLKILSKQKQSRKIRAEKIIAAKTLLDLSLFNEEKN